MSTCTCTRCTSTCPCTCCNIGMCMCMCIACIVACGDRAVSRERRVTDGALCHGRALYALRHLRVATIAIMMVPEATPPRRRCCSGACCLAFLLLSIATAGYAHYDLQRPTAQEFRERYGTAAFVAGASEGLGAAWAEYLAARGLNLVIIARHPEPLEATAKRLRDAYGVEVETSTLDLAQEDDVIEYTHRLFRHRPDIRLVVYNAAYTGYHAGIYSVDSLENAHTAVDVNIKSVLSVTHPFLSALRARDERGGLVLMSSMAGLVGAAHLSVYASTKAWTTAFATGLYEELRPEGVDVLACIAGATTTPNYLMDALPTRSTLIEQPPDAVVDECAGALGRMPTRATGLINRFAQVLMTRLLPTSLAARIVSDSTLSTTKFDVVGPWAKQDGADPSSAPVEPKSSNSSLDELPTTKASPQDKPSPLAKPPPSPPTPTSTEPQPSSSLPSSTSPSVKPSPAPSLARA